MSNFRLYNDTLTPEMWDTAEHLDPKIRINLLQMAYDFYEKTELPAPIVDVYFMGSSANYNWTPDSDVDVHVIIDYAKLQMPAETAAKTVKTAGAQWNAEHNVYIKGHKVEMNIQNAAEQKPHVTGIYSLMNDQWIRRPAKMTFPLDKNIIKTQYEAMKAYVMNAINTGNRDQMKSVKKYLDAYRQYGLDTVGELSYENIIYKILRARGIIKHLKDSIVQIYDKSMTVDEDDTSHSSMDDFIGTIDGDRVIASRVKNSMHVVHRDYGMRSERPQNWRYKKSRNTVYWNDYPDELDKTVVGNYLQRFGISNFNNSLVSRYKDWMGEVSDKSIKQSLPSLSLSDSPEYGSSKFDRGISSKYNKGTQQYNFQQLTLDELKALREKSMRMLKSFSKNPEANAAWIQWEIDNIRKLGAEIKRRLAYINAPVNESPMIGRKGDTVMADDKPLKGMKAEELDNNIVLIRQPTAGLVAAGFTVVYFMDSEESAHAMAHGKIPYLMVPRGTYLHGGSPITDVWKKKYNKPGTEHILGLIEGNSNDEVIFIDMITVRPGYKRNSVASLMIDTLKRAFPKAKITTSTQTHHGQKFFSKYDKDAQQVKEGVGAGVPEDDRLKIKNTDGSVRRWQVRSKDAPKTPKFTGEEVIAVPEYDEPQKVNEDRMPEQPIMPTNGNRVDLHPKEPMDELPEESKKLIKTISRILDKRAKTEPFFTVEYIEDLIGDAFAIEYPYPISSEIYFRLVKAIMNYLSLDYDIRQNGKRLRE